MNNELSDLVHRTKEQRIAYKGAKNSFKESDQLNLPKAQFEFLKAQKKLMDEFPDYKPPLKDMPLEFRCQVVNHYPSSDKRVVSNDDDSQ